MNLFIDIATTHGPAVTSPAPACAVPAPPHAPGSHLVPLIVSHLNTFSCLPPNALEISLKGLS